MKRRTLKRSLSLLLALVLCFATAIPAFAATSASAPLTGIAIAAGKTDDFKLAPQFQQNTQVYTVTNKTTAGEMPTSKADALAIIGYTAPDGTNVATDYDAVAQLLTLTTTNGGKSTTYYVSFSDTSEQVGTTNVANVEITKILEADADAKLDNLSFTYELTPAKIVENTAPTTVNTIPIANGANSGTDATGTVTVTADATKATMVIDNWDGDNVPLVKDNTDLAAAQEDLKDNKYITGKYTLTFDNVGQYKYVLHEVPGTVTGVTYDDSYYEVTISAVHSDPSDPTSAVVIGWIEVREITTYTSNTEYEAGDKVNFGKTTTIDDEKYDNLTTSITYPFINTLATEDLVVSKTVTGDLGDANQEFLFELTIGGTNLAAAYQISYTESVAAPQLMPETIATDGSTGTAYITLKHGQTFTVAELPVGATYTVKEIAAADDHLTTAAEAANYNTTITYDDTINGEHAVVRDVAVGKELADHAILDTQKAVTNDRNFVDVVNDKPLTPPTGIFADMIPYIAVVAVALGGVAVFLAVRKSKKGIYED